MIADARSFDMRVAAALLAAALAGSLAPRGALGQSPTLWERRDPRMANLYQDLKARAVGDVLTVSINENTDVANSDSRSLSKDGASGADASYAFDTGGSSGSASADFSTSAKRSFDGDARFRTEREFTDRFSVTVIDVQPNGNLVVAGHREMVVEGDRRRLSLSGLVRPSDIRADNSVLSQLVTDLRIEWQGAGVETRFTHQGWFGRALNRLWPF